MARLFSVTATSLICFLSSYSAQAQFVGDVYFLQPSIAIPSGQTGDLDLAIFTGDKPFGATTVALTYDPAKLRIEAISGGTNGENNLKVESLVDGGVARIVAINVTSLGQPFGSVAIARLKMRPLGSPGDRAILHSSVSRALFSDRSAIRAGTGFDAEITVGQATAVTTAAGGRALVVARESPLGDRALRLRPPGSEVPLIAKLTNGTIGEVRVKTESSATIRD